MSTIGSPPVMTMVCSAWAERFVARAHGPAVIRLADHSAGGRDDGLDRQHEPLGQRLRQPRNIDGGDVGRFVDLPADLVTEQFRADEAAFATDGPFGGAPRGLARPKRSPGWTDLRPCRASTASLCARGEKLPAPRCRPAPRRLPSRTSTLWSASRRLRASAQTVMPDGAMKEIKSPRGATTPRRGQTPDGGRPARS